MLLWNPKNKTSLLHISAFGFCEYIAPAAALRAMRLLNGFQLGDKNLLVSSNEKYQRLTLFDEIKVNMMHHVIEFHHIFMYHVFFSFVMGFTVAMYQKLEMFQKSAKDCLNFLDNVSMMTGGFFTLWHLVHCCINHNFHYSFSLLSSSGLQKVSDPGNQVPRKCSALPKNFQLKSSHTRR